jgi:D-alanyl-lipoteichoic acid acyltransferase DltB (MBOAT superfamily)
MLFNSIEFAYFLVVVFFLYWFVFHRNLKVQNAFLFVCSYFFYGWWDWRFLFLIAFTSTIDFLVGKQIHSIENDIKRKLLLVISIILNLSLLCFFKYFNFFVESFAQAFTLLGKPIEPTRLNVILPVGISFYTFQSISYTVDVYRRKLKPSDNLITFYAFVSFFPQLVAGPIERATNMLPQFNKKRIFDAGQANDGLRQILWGLFKKIVIADGCAGYVNEIFGNYSNLSGSTLMLGAVLFAFQIYGDFSGYSDIAIGTARLLGFNLMRNFAFPYFSRDIAEFWRRWHISLSTWFRDYLYIPLGGSHGAKSKVIRNTFLIFMVSGFWHGANWTFIVWGFLHALYFLPLLLFNQNRKNRDTVAQNRLLPSIKEVFQIIITFILITLAWVFFRSDNLISALQFIANIFQPSLFQTPQILPFNLLLMIALMIVFEWLQRENQHALQLVEMFSFKPLRWIVYGCVILLIYFLGDYSTVYEFIYFQF